MARTRHTQNSKSFVCFCRLSQQGKKRRGKEKTWKIVESFTFPRRLLSLTLLFYLWTKWITRWRGIAREKARPCSACSKNDERRGGKMLKILVDGRRVCHEWRSSTTAMDWAAKKGLKIEVWKILVFASMKKRRGGKIVGIAIYNCNLWICQSKHVVHTTTQSVSTIKSSQHWPWRASSIARARLRWRRQRIKEIPCAKAVKCRSRRISVEWKIFKSSTRVRRDWLQCNYHFNQCRPLHMWMATCGGSQVGWVNTLTHLWWPKVDFIFYAIQNKKWTCRAHSLRIKKHSRTQFRYV